MGEVVRSIERKIEAGDLSRPRCGAIACLQRFGSALNSNPHIHAIVLDGAYLERSSEGEAELEFRAVDPPTPREIGDVSSRVCRRVIQLLERRGIADADGLIPKDVTTPEHKIHEAAARVFPLFARVHDGHVDPVHERSAHGRSGEVRGFSTHADVSATAGDKEARRRIVRYCVRPPLAEKQVSATRDGRVALELRHPRSNGATHIVLSEIGFVKRLAALVPPPKQHQVRYFGVLSSASPLRRLVIPSPPLEIDLSPMARLVAQPIEAPTIASPARRASWAALIRRVYGVDALVCPTCPNGRLRIITAITEVSTIRKILAHLGLDDEPPRRSPDLRWTDP